MFSKILSVILVSFLFLSQSFANCWESKSGLKVYKSACLEEIELKSPVSISIPMGTKLRKAASMTDIIYPSSSGNNAQVEVLTESRSFDIKKVFKDTEDSSGVMMLVSDNGKDAYVWVKKAFIPTSLGLSNIECSGYDVALTFDDGPYLFPNKTGSYNNRTEDVMKVLKEQNVPAAFFFNGLNFDTRNEFKHEMTPERMQWLTDKNISRTADQKSKGLDTVKAALVDPLFTVGNHGQYHFSHADKEFYEAVEDNVKYSQDLIERAKNEVSEGVEESFNLFRFPYGACWNTYARFKQCDIAKSYDYHIGWDVDSNDWKYDESYIKANQETKKQIVETMVNDIQNQICENKGGVVLLHDRYSVTSENIELIVKSLKDRGHNIKPLVKVESGLATLSFSNPKTVSAGISGSPKPEASASSGSATE